VIFLVFLGIWIWDLYYLVFVVVCFYRFGIIHLYRDHPPIYRGEKIKKRSPPTGRAIVIRLWALSQALSQVP